MSAFTEAEIEYLRGGRLGRLATVGRDGRPHIAPVTFVFNPDEDAIDIGGVFFADTKKWRDVQHDPKVAFIVDDSTGTSARGVEIRGEAEPHTSGGESINPRFPQFKPEFIRIRPTRIVAWGIESVESGQDFAPNARDVPAD